MRLLPISTMLSMSTESDPASLSSGWISISLVGAAEIAGDHAGSLGRTMAEQQTGRFRQIGRPAAPSADCTVR